MGQGLPDYGTHHPILAAAVLATEGPIIELGCGHYSTPLLHQMSLVSGRRLVSTETDAEWMSLFTDMASDLHTFQHVDPDGWGRFPLEGRMWGVAFVDCAPGEYRKIAIERLKEQAQLIVVHDTETDHGTGADYQLEPVFARFPHRSDYKRYRPYTTVVSATLAFPISQCDQQWDPGTTHNPSDH